MAIPVNTQSGMDAMVQAAQVGQAASSAAFNFAKVEESAANRALKYAELQQKFQEIEVRDMEIDVLQQRQEGALAEAGIFSDRATNLWKNVKKMTDADTYNLATTTIQSLAQMQDAERQALVPLGEQVNDAQSHGRAYEQARQLLETVGKTPEDLGITKQYQGTDTKGEWKAIQDMAAASGKILEQERLKNTEYGLMVDRDRLLYEQNLGRDFNKFLYDNYLDQQKLRAQRDIARMRALAASSPEGLKISDIDRLSPDQAANILGPQVESILNNVGFFDASDEEIQKKTNKLVQESLKQHDNEIRNYFGDKRNANMPRSIHTIMQEKVGDFVSRIGTDGREYPNYDNPKLKKQRISWKERARDSKIVRAEIQQRGLDEQGVQMLLEGLWRTPTSRWK